MRILVNGMLLGGYFSGVDVTISGLARALRTYGRHSYVFVHPVDANLDVEETDSFKLHPVRVPRTSRISRIAWEQLRLPGSLKALNCDILHCPGYVAPFLAPAPTVLTVHDCFALNHPEWCKWSNRLHYRLTFKRSLKRAAATIVPSTFVKRELMASFKIPENKLNVIPFAPSERFTSGRDVDLETKLKSSLKLPDRYILFVGNVEPKKNLPGIVNGFAKFATSNDEARSHHLVIVGGDGWGVALESIIRRSGVADRIHRIGRVPLSDLPSLYHLSDCLLFPSLSEGFGLPVIEAMACGTPVVAANRGALPELVTDAGILVAPNDAIAIAAKLAELTIDEDLRRDWAAKAARRAREFSWRRTAEATDAVYEAVANNVSLEK